MSKSQPIPIPQTKKPLNFAKPRSEQNYKPKITLKPKINPLTIKIKSPHETTQERKRKEILAFIESKFCPSTLGRMYDNVVRSYAIPDVDPNDPDLEPDEEKWGEIILAFNQEHIMKRLTESDIDYLYITKDRIEKSRSKTDSTTFPIRFMDEEEMMATFPADYFIFNLKGELILACYR